MPYLPFVYGYPSSSPRAHCNPHKSVPTLRYTRRHGPVHTGPCPKALTECSPLTTNKNLLVSRQFSGPYGVTKYGSGWRNDIVNQCLECALHSDVGTATPPFSGWYGAHRHPIRSVYSAVRFNGSLFLYTSHSSGAVLQSRWPSWAVCPNEPSGFRGRKELLNRASALVSACP